MYVIRSLKTPKNMSFQGPKHAKMTKSARDSISRGGITSSDIRLPSRPVYINIYTRVSQKPPSCSEHCVSYMWLHIYLKRHPKKLVSFHGFLRSGHLFFFQCSIIHPLCFCAIHQLMSTLNLTSNINSTWIWKTIDWEIFKRIYQTLHMLPEGCIYLRLWKFFSSNVLEVFKQI